MLLHLNPTSRLGTSIIKRNYDYQSKSKSNHSHNLKMTLPFHHYLVAFFSMRRYHTRFITSNWAAFNLHRRYPMHPQLKHSLACPALGHLPAIMSSSQSASNPQCIDLQLTVSQPSSTESRPLVPMRTMWPTLTVQERFVPSCERETSRWVDLRVSGAVLREKYAEKRQHAAAYPQMPSWNTAAVLTIRAIVDVWCRLITIKCCAAPSFLLSDRIRSPFIMKAQQSS